MYEKKKCISVEALLQKYLFRKNLRYSGLRSHGWLILLKGGKWEKEIRKGQKREERRERKGKDTVVYVKQFISKSEAFRKHIWN